MILSATVVLWRLLIWNKLTSFFAFICLEYDFITNWEDIFLQSDWVFKRRTLPFIESQFIFNNFCVKFPSTGSFNASWFMLSVFVSLREATVFESIEGRSSLHEQLGEPLDADICHVLALPRVLASLKQNVRIRACIVREVSLIAWNAHVWTWISLLCPSLSLNENYLLGGLKIFPKE